MAEVRRNRAFALAPLALCGALAACSSTSDYALDLLADPGQYQYHDCAELAAAAKQKAARRKELQQLIDKAEQGTGGTLVSVIAYRGEYRSTGEELAIIAREQRAKKCLTESNWRSNGAIR